MWYHINNIKYTNTITTHFFHYLLFYMKPDTVSITISGITDLSSIIDLFTLIDNISQLVCLDGFRPSNA